MELSVLLGRFLGNRDINHRIVSELASIWTSVALTLAAAAACVGLLRRLKIRAALRRRSRMPSWADFADADDVDYSSCSSSDGDEEQEEQEEEESDSDSEAGDGRGRDGELVAGRSAFWSTREEVAWGGDVVKTWEGIGLGLESDRPAGKRVPLSSLFDLGCGGGEFSTAAVRVWKAMAASQGPASSSGGSSIRRRASAGSDARSAWEETRWDAGTGRGAEEDEERDPCAGRGRSGSSVVVTWCCNAVSRLPLLPSPAARNGTRPRLPP